MDKGKLIMNGYQDARQGSPYKRAPDYPAEVLQLNRDQAPEPVRLYWSGWAAGINDNVRDIMKKVKGGE